MHKYLPEHNILRLFFNLYVSILQLATMSTVTPAIFYTKASGNAGNLSALVFSL